MGPKSVSSFTYTHLLFAGDTVDSARIRFHERDRRNLPIRHYSNALFVPAETFITREKREFAARRCRLVRLKCKNRSTSGGVVATALLCDAYIQFSEAVPLTFGEVLSIVLLIVMVRSTGAVALTVTTP